MSKKLLLIAAAFAGIAGLYELLMCESRELAGEGDDHASEAQWANEGGANSPPSV
jgi:hypothetical protein